MTKKRTAPTTLGRSAGAKGVQTSTDQKRFEICYKDTTISLSKLQYALFILLSNGKKHSSHKIMQIIHTSDPRKEVQYLRRKGITVQDIWVEAERGIPRHKLYFINPKECGDE